MDSHEKNQVHNIKMTTQQSEICNLKKEHCNCTRTFDVDFSGKTPDSGTTLSCSLVFKRLILVTDKHRSV